MAKRSGPHRHLLGVVIMDTFLLAVLTVFIVMIVCDRRDHK
nr:MAG TPA: hypothetical protein [Caudoviricetes sp.]